MNRTAALLQMVESASVVGTREQTITLYEQIVPVCSRLGSTHAGAAAAANLGGLLLDAGRLDRASEVLESARKQHADSDIFLPYIELQRVKWMRLSGRWTQGLELVAGVLAGDTLTDRGTTVADGNSRTAGVVDLHALLRGLLLGERARLELELGRIDLARLAAEEEYALAERRDDGRLRVDALLALADCDYLANDPNGTLRTVDELRRETLTADLEGTIDWLEAMARGGLVLNGVPDPERIGRAVEPLKGLLERNAVDELAAQDVEWLLAELALASEDFATAADWIRRSRARFDAWQQVPGSIGTRELRLLANEAQVACAVDAPRDVLEATLRDLERGFETLLERWAETDIDPGGVGLLESEERRGLLGELIRVRGQLEGDGGLARAFADLMQAQAMGSQARTAAVGVPGLEEVRAELLENGGLLLFVVTGATTHLLAIDGEGLRAFELGGRNRLQLASDELGALLREDELSSGQLEQLMQLSEELGSELVPEAVWEHIRHWPSAVVVGFDTLRGTPISALTVPGGRLLGEALAVAEVASIPIALAQRRRERQRVAPELALSLLVDLEPEGAAAERFPKLESVPFETLDLGRQQRAYPEPRRETLAGATPADFLSALERAAVVHVLAHGVLDPYRERGSGILLGPGAESDGSLWPEDLEHLEPRSRALVVLASCGTAVGPRRTGDDGPTSFASTLLARGASGVITTAARLELRLAEDLTARFHHHLARGQSAAEALRRSKEELGSRDRARAFALAKVRLLGSVAGPFEHQPLIEGRTKTTPWLVGGAVVALLVALLAKLRRSRPPSRRPGALAEPSGVAAVGMRSRRD